MAPMPPVPAARSVSSRMRNLSPAVLCLIIIGTEGAAADGEGQAMARQATGIVGFQDDIGCGVVGRRVHRIRTVEALGSREPDVAYDDVGDDGCHGLCSPPSDFFRHCTASWI